MGNTTQHCELHKTQDAEYTRVQKNCIQMGTQTHPKEISTTLVVYDALHTKRDEFNNGCIVYSTKLLCAITTTWFLYHFYFCTLYM